MNIAYVYPWDVVGDPSAAARIASLGVEAVALAASYHSARVVTPHHPAHRVLEATHSAFYLPVRPSAWGRLVPASPGWTTADSWLRARDALGEAGLKVLAWTVLTHNSWLGSRNPDLVVRNAFHGPYPHALCPAHDDVLDYCQRLVREIVTAGEPDGIVLEACGPMGYGHQSPHEKTAGADWTGVHQDLLSLCFCAACADRYPAGTLEAVRAAVDGSPTSMADALGDLHDQVRDVRVALSAGLRERVLPACGELPITLHANPDPWATGAFAALPAGDPRAHVLVGSCWGDPVTDAGRLGALGALAAEGQRVGAYVLALPPRPADPGVLAEHLRIYGKAGAQEFHLYHAGLASPARLDALREALARQ
ncbi:hypothetical protein [Nonomuraea soli]|uniref:Alanine-rich protein n=1 Tax=Nonomuraea soli TaxID=1032476 RepID=A0A7W0HMM5_9ACTN|nr:hypothetical protein [Nonomuraea soli]MBA2888893.1 hypothetical protein [Nonomuraea soli]